MTKTPDCRRGRCNSRTWSFWSQGSHPNPCRSTRWGTKWTRCRCQAWGKWCPSDCVGCAWSAVAVRIMHEEAHLRIADAKSGWAPSTPERLLYLDGLAIVAPSEVESLARVSTVVIVELHSAMTAHCSKSRAYYRWDKNRPLEKHVTTMPKWSRSVCHGKLEVEPLGNELE